MYEYKRKRPIIGDVLLRPAELLVVGDSRAQDGIQLSGLRRTLDYRIGMYASAVNYGAQMSDYTGHLLKLRPRKMILTLMPLGVYMRQNEIKIDYGNWELFRTAIDDLLNLAADRLRSYAFSPIIVTIRVNREKMTRFFSPLTFEGFAYPSKYSDLRNIRVYTRHMTRDKVIRKENMRRIGENVGKLLEKGWDIVCVRMPVAESLRKIEEDNFDCTAFVKMCEELEIKYLDYSRKNFQSFDGSHMDSFEAERFTRRLARDIKRVTGW
jgi:hypothetical protein